MNLKFFKLGAAAALTVGGVTATSTLKTVSASTFKTAVKRVKIKYLPGQGVKIWPNYQGGNFMGFRAKEGTEWNVVKTAVDKKGNLWYMVGDDEWIQARYTVDIEKDSEPTQSVKPAKSTKSKITALAKKAKQTATQTVNKIKPSKVTAAEKKQEKAEAQAQSKLGDKQANVKQAKMIIEQTLDSTQASGQSQSKINSIVSLAKSEVGKPYVWGATGPDSFDCSGLVQYVYGKAGINLPRTTYDQVKMGKTVSMSNLQPGDLLFWGSATAPYHVAIYVGNNQYVNSATPEQGIILQTISTYYYPTVAKRIL